MNYTTFVEMHGENTAPRFAESWETWRGDCHCGVRNAIGFCDRCVECAIESVYINEMDFGGTSEGVSDYFGIVDVRESHPHLADRLVAYILVRQAEIWRRMAGVYSR